MYQGERLDHAAALESTYIKGSVSCRGGTRRVAAASGGDVVATRSTRQRSFRFLRRLELMDSMSCAVDFWGVSRVV